MDKESKTITWKEMSKEEQLSWMIKTLEEIDIIESFENVGHELKELKKQKVVNLQEYKLLKYEAVWKLMIIDKLKANSLKSTDLKPGMILKSKDRTILVTESYTYSYVVALVDLCNPALIIQLNEHRANLDYVAKQYMGDENVQIFNSHEYKLTLENI